MYNPRAGLSTSFVPYERLSEFGVIIEDGIPLSPDSEETAADWDSSNQQYVPEVTGQQNENQTEPCQSTASSTPEPLLGAANTTPQRLLVVRLEPLDVGCKTHSTTANARSRQLSPQAGTSRPSNSKSHTRKSSPPRLSQHAMCLRPRTSNWLSLMRKRMYVCDSSDDEVWEPNVSKKKRKKLTRAARSKKQSTSAKQREPTGLTRDDPIRLGARDKSTPRSNPRKRAVRFARTSPDATVSTQVTSHTRDPMVQDHSTVRDDQTVRDNPTAADKDTAASFRKYEEQIRCLKQKLKTIEMSKRANISCSNSNLETILLAEITGRHSEVDSMAAALDREPDVKTVHRTQSSDDDQTPGGSASSAEGGSLLEAPVFHPTKEEFKDPIAYYTSLHPQIVKYGICKVVPPPDWTPPSEVHGNISFDVMNQYISRLFSRWGPAARELSAIKLCLKRHNISFERPPQFNGVEINLSKLYHVVQRHGGLEAVTNKKRWGNVADSFKIRKTQDFEKKLENIYLEFLLIYDTLTYHERQKIMSTVEVAWNKKNQRLLDRALNPLYQQKRMLGIVDSLENSEDDDEDTASALHQVEDSTIRGRPMTLKRFKKVASMLSESMIDQGSEEAPPPTLQHIEEQYWHHVTSGTEHTCVHTAEVDISAEGQGVSTHEEPCASHPFHLKKIVDHPNNMLRYLGPLMGVTVPTLTLGMIFSTTSWRQHLFPQISYQRSGPPKIWYSISFHHTNNFRKALQILSPTSCQNKSLWLSSEIMIPPNLLREHNVSLTRVTQDEREFVLAVPKAYSCSISTGYTESESVYFAPMYWLDCLSNAFKEARESCEPTMFSMDHLLYKIGCDRKPRYDLLECALLLFGRMLFEEVTNRQMLQERGLPFVQKLLKDPKQTQRSYRDECNYCRCSLFLSKVKGLPNRNSVLCLQHTLTLLDTERYQDTQVDQLQVLVHVSIKELNRVQDNMKRRMGLY